MNNKNIIMILGLICTFCFSCDYTNSGNDHLSDSGDILSPGEYPENEAIVSFSYDDGSDTWYNTGYPLFNEYGFKATFNVNASWVQSRSDWVMELYENGFEFANHTYDHGAGITDNNVRDMAFLLRDMDLPAGGFVGPGQGVTPAWGHDQVKIVKEYHNYYSQGYTSTGLTRPFDMFYLQRFGLSNNVTASEITEALEYAAANNTWIIFSGHPIQGVWIEDDPVNGGDYAQSPELLEYVLSEIQRLDIQVKTVGEVVNSYHPPGRVIDCSADEYQSPVLSCFEEGDLQNMDTSVWNEYWHNTGWSPPRYIGSPAVYCHTSNKSLPVMTFSKAVPNGQYSVRAEIIPFSEGSAYRVYYSFDESDPSRNSVEISGKTDADLGVVDITDGHFNLYTQKADVLSGSDDYIGWAFIKLFAVSTGVQTD